MVNRCAVAYFMVIYVVNGKITFFFYKEVKMVENMLTGEKLSTIVEINRKKLVWLFDNLMRKIMSQKCLIV
jgi:hypothetical protein